ncbi:hypothetical protein ElyMa_006795300 [Elysia marginata]|uniref:Ig-like domain-containing protein n=1 Tax=Elysia marginata TaxID=1093978 RepID=A0AAV4J760_9GAST|nr:hypothetical protein ElyMa_006795300 [Elysia marginata]
MKGYFCLIALALTLWSKHLTQAAQDTTHKNFQSFPFRVSYRPVDLVKGQTQNVSLKCAIVPNSDHPFIFLDAIIISKEHPQGGWVDVAKIDYLKGLQTFEQGITADGHINHVEQAYLEIRWPLAVDETFGIYSCIVHGNDQDFKVLEETSEILIKQHDCKDM